MTDQSPPQLEPALVREFVIAAHRDSDRVKEMLDVEPALLKSCWNWGGGDWETALWASAHTGQREIALYLIEHGAAIDLFSAAMLGELQVVKTIIEYNPSMRFATGAHNIPLLVHAQVGGDAAIGVVNYLQSFEAQ